MQIQKFKSFLESLDEEDRIIMYKDYKIYIHEDISNFYESEINTVKKTIDFLEPIFKKWFIVDKTFDLIKSHYQKSLIFEISDSPNKIDGYIPVDIIEMILYDIRYIFKKDPIFCYIDEDDFWNNTHDEKSISIEVKII